MTFAEHIDKLIRKNKVLEMGEVRISRAYLFGKKYSIVIEKIKNSKLHNMEIRFDGELLLKDKGTLSYVIHRASGYVLNH